MRGRIVLGIVGGGLVAAILLLLGLVGVPIAFSLAWTLLLVAVALASRQLFFDETVSWAPEERPRSARGSEVSRLAWSINTRTGVAGHVVVRRVQGVLRRRLTHRGLDLDDPSQHPAIDELLGPDVRMALHRREVHRSDIERVLDAVERLPAHPEESR